jgi:AbrB family looped-hinge helix DNA binding protein
MRRRLLGTPAIPLPRIATLTSKGQLTLPVAVRRRWRLGPGDKVALVIQKGALTVRPLPRSRPKEVGGTP